MRELQDIMADRELSRAITALYLEVDESIVNNLRSKVDAALRRAKAEGAREMIKIVKANRADQRVADDLNNTVSFDSFNAVLDAITREIDARAAQIENEATK